MNLLEKLKMKLQSISSKLWIYKSTRIYFNIKKGIKDIKNGHITKIKNLKKFLKEL